MTDTGHHFAPVFDYDEHVPADLLVRWHRTNPDRLVLADLGCFLGAWGGLAIALVGALALLTGPVTLLTGVAVMLAGLLVTGAALLVRRRQRRRTGLAGRDIDLVLAHRTEIRFDPWNDLAGRGRPLPTWAEEARLAYRAGRALDGIRATAIWSDPDRLDHRIRLDPDEATRQVHVSAWRLHRLRRDLGPRPSGPDTDRLADEWDTAAAHLDDSTRVLREHVDTIEDYRRAIDEQNRHLQLDRRYAELRHLSDGIEEHLAAQDARHELATDHLTGLHRELKPASDANLLLRAPRSMAGPLTQHHDRDG